MGLSSAAAAAAAVPLGDCGSGKPAESFTNRDGEALGDEVVEAETDPLKKKIKKRKRPTAGVETGSVGLKYHGGFKLWRSSLGAGPKKIRNVRRLKRVGFVR